MDKYIYDESNGLWYELQGDYYIPCLTLPTEKEHKPIGLWGRLSTNAIYRNINGQFTHAAHKRKIERLSC